MSWLHGRWSHRDNVVSHNIPASSSHSIDLVWRNCVPIATYTTSELTEILSKHVHSPCKCTCTDDVSQTRRLGYGVRALDWHSKTCTAMWTNWICMLQCQLCVHVLVISIITPWYEWLHLIRLRNSNVGPSRAQFCYNFSETVIIWRLPRIMVADQAA
jgi:hypothetical protein